MRYSRFGYRRCYNTVRLSLVLLAMLPGVALGQWVEWYSHGELAWEYDNNVNLSAFSDDQSDGHRLLLDLSGGRFFQMNGRTRLHAQLDLGAIYYERFPSLSQLNSGATLGIKHKFGVGRQVSRLNAFVTGQRWTYRDEDRNSTVLLAGGAWRRPWTPRFDTRLGYRRLWRDGSAGPRLAPGISSDVYDLRWHRLEASGHYRLTSRLLATALVSYRNGDALVDCKPGVARMPAASDFDAQTVNNVFGDCLLRTEGDAWGYGMRGNFRLTRHVTLTGGFQAFAWEIGPWDYDKHIFQLGVLAHF